MTRLKFHLQWLYSPYETYAQAKKRVKAFILKGDKSYPQQNLNYIIIISIYI